MNGGTPVQGHILRSMMASANSRQRGAKFARREGIRANLLKASLVRVIDEAILREARAMQADRSDSLLGIASTGRIVPAAAAVVPMIRNTNHGAI